METAKVGIQNGTNEGVGRGASYAKLIIIVVRLLGEKGRGNIDGIVVGDVHSIKQGLWVGVELVGRRVGTGVEIIDLSRIMDNHILFFKASLIPVHLIQY